MVFLFYSVLIFMADVGKNSCEQVDWLIGWLIRLVGWLIGWLVRVAVFSRKLQDRAVFSRQEITRPVWHGSSWE